MKLNNISFSLVLSALLLCSSCSKEVETNTAENNKSSRARPSSQQVKYQQKEKIAFIHFGMNTFTDHEWGTGKADPSHLNPTDLDAEQWAKTLSENGFKTLILTAKHHDGFCLWTSKYTDYTVASSPYKDGEGDIVKEVSEACEKYGIDFGVYLSPWDRHEESYGTPEYNIFYLNQLKELLTNYGNIAEVWFDGAKGEDAQDMEYNFDRWWTTVRNLQPDALIFSDEGPDIRWIGNENGIAGQTNWSTVNRDSLTVGKPGQKDYLNSGEKGAPDWVVGECDVSIRPGWFYSADEDDKVKTVDDLVDIYLKSVGRNCTLLLNIPPDRTGKLHPTDVERLYAFTDTLESMFDDNLVSAATIKASSSNSSGAAEQILDGNWDSFWKPADSDKEPTLTLQFDKPIAFDILSLQEYIPKGQRISKFDISIKKDGNWKTIADETTVGYKRILSFDEVTTDQIQIRFKETLATPIINNIELYHTNSRPK